MDTDNCWYSTCPLTFKDHLCKKKLTPIEHGVWNFQRCNHHVYECEYRYIFQFCIEDQTSKINVTAFQDVAKQLIGIPTHKLFDYGYEGNTEETTNIFAKLFFNSYFFKLAVHEETFANQKQIKHIVIACDKMDCLKTTKKSMPTHTTLPK